MAPQLHGDTILFHEAHVRIGPSHGWCEEYRVHVDWQHDLADDMDVPVVAHITLSGEPSDRAHDLLSAPSGSLPRQLGEQLKTEWEGDALFMERACEARGHDNNFITAAEERMDIAREYA